MNRSRKGKTLAEFSGPAIGLADAVWGKAGMFLFF
jgi:hypothetical protein